MCVVCYAEPNTGPHTSPLNVYTYTSSSTFGTQPFNKTESESVDSEHLTNSYDSEIVDLLNLIKEYESESVNPEQLIGMYEHEPSEELVENRDI